MLAEQHAKGAGGAGSAELAQRSDRRDLQLRLGLDPRRTGQPRSCVRLAEEDDDLDSGASHARVWIPGQRVLHQRQDLGPVVGGEGAERVDPDVPEGILGRHVPQRAARGGRFAPGDPPQSPQPGVGARVREQRAQSPGAPRQRGPNAGGVRVPVAADLAAPPMAGEGGPHPRVGVADGGVAEHAGGGSAAGERSAGGQAHLDVGILQHGVGQRLERGLAPSERLEPLDRLESDGRPEVEQPGDMGLCRLTQLRYLRLSRSCQNCVGAEACCKQGRYDRLVHYEPQIRVRRPGLPPNRESDRPGCPPLRNI